MTGVSELRQTYIVSAAPDQIRVSVFGGCTQLDIALPLDVPVSAVVPDLARLVRSRDAQLDEEPNKGERRSFWVLSRFDSGIVVNPDQTLREAGVTSGELLRLSSQRALSPPTLYDDVVDAVGRLNKAAYAAWDATSARWMAFAAVHLAVLGLVYCLCGRVDAANRWVIVGLAAAVAVALVGGAAMAYRSYGLDDVAAALGWAAIPITAGLAWTLLARLGDYGLAAGCAAVLVLCLIYDRVIGTGHWAYLAGVLLFGWLGIAFLARALHVRADLVFVTLSVLATLQVLAVPPLTARLGRFKTPTVAVETKREDWDFENPFEPSAPAKNRDDDSSTTMPSAEAVWTKAKSAAITRAALLAGLSAVTAFSLGLLPCVGGVPNTMCWPRFALGLTCAAVLGLRARGLDTAFERAAVAVPAVAIVVFTCAMAQGGIRPMPVAGLGVLLAVAIGAGITGLTLPDRGPAPRLSSFLSYVNYLAVGSLIPLALWLVGVYQRLGF